MESSHLRIRNRCSDPGPGGFVLRGFFYARLCIRSETIAHGFSTFVRRQCYHSAVDRNRNATAITILNLKGGVGKTHTAWLTAAACEETGFKLLLVDLDPQANLTSSFRSTDVGERSVEALFDPAADCDITTLVRNTEFRRIDLIPASAALARFDVANQRDWEAADLHLSLTDAVEELRPHYDLILFDCPPRLSLVSFAALCASDGVVIPMEAADWGAQGIVQVTEAVRYVQERFNSRLQLLGYVVSRFKRARAYQQSYLKQLRAHFGEMAFDTVIPDLARFEKSVTDRIPITLHAPGSPEAHIARRFFAELYRRAQGVHGSGRGSRRENVQRTAFAGAER